MSRSNPQAINPHPADKWFEWNGEKGEFQYYDKVKEARQQVPLPFSFILLDELAVVRGWHEPSESGITSNEVRDTRSDPFVVKAFKGGKIAEGFWQQIRDRVNNAGGEFNVNLYVAYKEDGELKIGSVMLHGAALNAYIEWRREEGNELVEVGGRKIPARYQAAMQVKKFGEGVKGKVKYRFPEFELTATKSETNAEAISLDQKLQVYLDGYFKRTRVEQVPDEPEKTDAEGPQPDAPDDKQLPQPVPSSRTKETKYEPQDDDVPF